MAKKRKLPTRNDVLRQLGELAFGRANDCVRLVMEEKPELDALGLDLLSEVKRSEKGALEVKLVDRLAALRQLESLLDGTEQDPESFLAALSRTQPPDAEA